MRMVLGIWMTMLISHAAEPDTMLDENCLACHREQKLPDNLIYRRYLLKYSSPARIENALTVYLKAPSKSRSIMPKEFFLRFPIKYPTDLNDAELKQSIQAYMERFDIKRRLRLEE
jgi:hypothetical protein